MKFRIALAFLASMGSVRPALAREGAASGVVSIGLPSCAAAPFDKKQLLQVLAVELTPHQLRPEVQADVPKLAAARVELAVASCARSNDRVMLQIWDVQRKLFVQRSVSLRAVASSARARTLALVITDALHPPSLPLVPDDPPSVPTEPDDPPSVPAESSVPTASAALATRPDEPERDPLFETSDPYSTPRRLRVGATVHARFANHRQNTLLGLEANAHGPLWAGVEWAIEGSYSEGELLSSLEMAWLNGALGVDIVTSGKPSFGIGPRVSFAHVSSQVAEGLGLVEPFQSVFLTLLGARAGLSGRVGESSLLEVMLEAAHSVSTVPVSEVSRGDGTLPFPSQGWILTLGLGLAFQN